MVAPASPVRASQALASQAVSSQAVVAVAALLAQRSKRWTKRRAMLGSLGLHLCSTAAVVVGPASQTLASQAVHSQAVVAVAVAALLAQLWRRWLAVLGTPGLCPVHLCSVYHGFGGRAGSLGGGFPGSGGGGGSAGPAVQEDRAAGSARHSAASHSWASGCLCFDRVRLDAWLGVRRQKTRKMWAGKVEIVLHVLEDLCLVYLGPGNQEEWRDWTEEHNLDVHRLEG